MYECLVVYIVCKLFTKTIRQALPALPDLSLSTVVKSHETLFLLNCRVKKLIGKLTPMHIACLQLSLNQQLYILSVNHISMLLFVVFPELNAEN